MEAVGGARTARQHARDAGGPVGEVPDVNAKMTPRRHGASVDLADVARFIGAHAQVRAGQPAVDVSDVTHDSRSAGPGVLYACRPGIHADGHDFAADAVAAGSPALLVERPLDLDVPQVRVDSVAECLGPAAALVHGQPALELALCGVTGTNGKTTIGYLLESVLRVAGHTTGLIGTVETRIAGRTIPGVRTTPEATDLQRLLRRMVDEGVTAAAMEVSSHGLALGRVNGTRFAVVLFTNLTHDHLDFHAGIEDYFAAKARLFQPAFAPVAVINVDDAYGRRLLGRTTVPALAVSATGAWPADATARDVEAGPTGSVFTALAGGRSIRVRTHLPGAFNVANALCALTAAIQIGVDAESAAEGIAALRGVPGRMERVEAGQPFTVLVDYAHTPDSLAQVLRTVRALVTATPAKAPHASSGQVIVVVGCGGDRDADKRPVMGRTAASLADFAVLTSDNPRSEDPLHILEQMAAGARVVPGGRWSVEPDRRAGIRLAVAAARPGDILVIAGKGHEGVQQLAGRTVPFDDRAVVRQVLAEQVGP